VTHWLQVVVQTPAYSGVGGPLTYRSELPLAAGTLVRVPLGARETLGVVWQGADALADGPPEGMDAARVREVAGVLDGIAPLNAGWRQLAGFAAHYYQRALGEVALSALPPALRDLSATQVARRLKRLADGATAVAAAATDSAPAAPQVASENIAISQEQAGALAEIGAQDGPFLLFGATGSGKTEVYLQAVQALLARDPTAQALVLVPEINLTPQLEARFIARFGPERLVSLHSGMTPPQRLNSWLAAHAGQARIVLGTRMAIFASMPTLKLIVVDEEHDPSYKQQEGARYSARDLAVYRARLEGAKVVLGSATPSLESWHRSRPAEGDDADGSSRGKYRRLHMPSRIGDGQLPRVRLVDMTRQPPRTVLSPPLMDAIGQRIARGEQVMVFLNRRGYAPVLACNACGWKSQCPHCSAFRVFHKIDRTLRCHHCGFAQRVPRACPDCGNLDIAPVGRGTERLEEHLAELLAGVRRPGSVTPATPEGAPVRIARIDADSTRLKGALETQLAQVHAGEVDVLVGTQMIAKGHDFRRVTLVAAINPDGALFSSDFRAPERLFSLLMQAAGRAGRDAVHSETSEMWIQTEHPGHALFGALKKHDYPAFAASQLAERLQAGMPPFSSQALVRADARTQEAAQAFLTAAARAAEALPGADQVTVYPAVPMAVQRVANVERAQMLVESPSRKALQRFLTAWQAELHAVRDKSVLRWAIDVDPLAI
jgi:primosomal protein N' (replication factor Y)